MVVQEQDPLKGEVGPDWKGVARPFEEGALYQIRWVPALSEHGCLLFKECRPSERHVQLPGIAS